MSGATGLQRIIMRDLAARILRQAADKLSRDRPDQVPAVEWLREQAALLERR